MYVRCLLIRNIISFSVRPAESPGHDVGSVVSKLKRSSLSSALGFHLSPAGLGGTPLLVPSAAGTREIETSYRYGSKICTSSFSMAERNGNRSGTERGLMRAQGPATALQGPRACSASPGQSSTPLCARSRSLEGRGSCASKAVSMIKRAGGNGVLMGLSAHTRYATNACLTALIARTE